MQFSLGLVIGFGLYAVLNWWAMRRHIRDQNELLNRCILKYHRDVQS
jgi:hypothetical protein